MLGLVVAMLDRLSGLPGVEVATTTREVPGYGLLQINRLAPSLGIPEITDAYVEIIVDSGADVAGLSVVDELQVWRPMQQHHCSLFNDRIC